MSAAVEQLVCQSQQGNSAALAALVERYQALLWRVVTEVRWQADSSGFEFDDLYQQAVLEFILLVREFDPERSNGFGPYAKGKLAWRVRNALRFHRRRRKGEETYGVALPPELADRHVAHLEITWGVYPVESQQLRRALRHLTQKQKALLAALYGTDCRIADLTRAWGVSARGLSAMRQRCLGTLRAELVEALP